MADFLIRAVRFNRLQRGIEFFQQRLVVRTYRDAEAGAEVLRIGHFRSGDAQLRVGLQPLIHHGSIAKHPVNTAIFQVDNRILIAVIGDGFNFRMFVLQVFLVGGAVFHTNTFAFQIGKGVEGVFFSDNQRRVSVVRIGKCDLFAALRSNVHPGNHRVIFFKFQRRDQAIESVVGKGTVSLHLFAQRFRQIQIETNDLIVSIHGFKRGVGCRNAEADFLCRGRVKCGSGEHCG